mmetsp:Transcript_88114/g.285158  ORF Transcript_88114/g.285158 Transcript_88114/m.285158 type:complete len:286 (+) Transcript_88114:1213-2070(+)
MPMFGSCGGAGCAAGADSWLAAAEGACSVPAAPAVPSLWAPAPASLRGPAEAPLAISYSPSPRSPLRCECAEGGLGTSGPASSGGGDPAGCASSVTCSVMLPPSSTSAMGTESRCCRRLASTALPGTAISEAQLLLWPGEGRGVWSPLSPGSSAALTAARAEANLEGVPRPKLGSSSVQDTPVERQEDNATAGVCGGAAAGASPGVTTSVSLLPLPGASGSAPALPGVPKFPAIRSRMSVSAAEMASRTAAGLAPSMDDAPESLRPSSAELRPPAADETRGERTV